MVRKMGEVSEVTIITPSASTLHKGEYLSGLSEIHNMPGF